MQRSGIYVDISDSLLKIGSGIQELKGGNLRVTDRHRVRSWLPEELPRCV